MDIASYRWMVVVALLLGAAPQAFSQGSGGPGRASVPAFTSPRTVPIDNGTLSALPRETVAASVHGKTVQCEGVSMTALLRAANVLTAEALSSTQLANYVLVTARDGSRALYSLAELESTLGNNRVLLLDRCDDARMRVSRCNHRDAGVEIKKSVAVDVLNDCAFGEIHD